MILAGLVGGWGESKFHGLGLIRFRLLAGLVRFVNVPDEAASSNKTADVPEFIKRFTNVPSGSDKPDCDRN
jgi:hypothetical protein